MKQIKSDMLFNCKIRYIHTNVGIWYTIYVCIFLIENVRASEANQKLIDYFYTKSILIDYFFNKSIDMSIVFTAKLLINQLYLQQN